MLPVHVLRTVSSRSLYFAWAKPDQTDAFCGYCTLVGIVIVALGYNPYKRRQLPYRIITLEGFEKLWFI